MSKVSTAQRNCKECYCHEHSSDMEKPGQLSHEQSLRVQRPEATVGCVIDGTNPAPGITLRNVHQQSKSLTPDAIV